MRLSSLVVTSALLTLSAVPAMAQGVMIRRPAAAQQEAPRTEPKQEPAPVQEPKAQDPREDIRKIVREELRAALREMRAAEAKAAEGRTAAAKDQDAKPKAAPVAKDKPVAEMPAGAPQVALVTPPEAAKPPAPETAPARPIRVRAMQQRQDPAAPKQEPQRAEGPAKPPAAGGKSQEEVMAELEAELAQIQSEIERAIAGDRKQEPAKKPAAEPTPAAPQPQERATQRRQERSKVVAPAPEEQQAEPPRQQPRRMMVMRSDEGTEQPMVIEMAPEAFDRRIEQDLRMQAEKGGIRVFRAETRTEQPQRGDEGGCNCSCDCCRQHRGNQPHAPQHHEPMGNPQQDRIQIRSYPGAPGDKVDQQRRMGMPMPPMAGGRQAPWDAQSMDPEMRRQVMERMRARIEEAQRRLREMEGQGERRSRDGRGRNVEFRRGEDV